MKVFLAYEPEQAHVAESLRLYLEQGTDYDLTAPAPFAPTSDNPQTRSEYAVEVIESLSGSDVLIALSRSGRVTDALVGMAVALNIEVISWVEAEQETLHPSPVMWAEHLWCGGGPLTAASMERVLDLLALLTLKLHDGPAPAKHWIEVGGQVLGRSMALSQELEEAHEMLEEHRRQRSELFDAATAIAKAWCDANRSGWGKMPDEQHRFVCDVLAQLGKDCAEQSESLKGAEGIIADYKAARDRVHAEVERVSLEAMRELDAYLGRLDEEGTPATARQAVLACKGILSKAFAAVKVVPS